jgi:hypothetical protein
LQVGTDGGWHAPEQHLEHRWRWSTERSQLRLTNTGAGAFRITVHARASAVGEPRSLRVSVGEKLLWGETIDSTPVEMRFGLTLPVGETVLVFATDRPAEKAGTDPRALAFQVANLEIVVEPPAGQR